MNQGNRMKRMSEGYKPQAIPSALRVVRGQKEGELMETLRVNPVELISLEERTFVGIAATSSFQQITGIGEARRLFMEKKDRIANLVNGEEYVALHFSNNVVFTYIYAVEVSELGMIPEGMMGLTVPGGRYAKARSREKDPYGLIHNYLNENGLSSNPAAFSLEVFRMGEEESKYHADIFVPVKEEDGYKPFVVPSSVMTIRDHKQETEQQRINGKIERNVPASREESPIQTVSCIELPVKNMQRAVDFYVFKLGFYMNTAKNRLPIEPGNTEVFIYPKEGVNIMLIQTDGEERLTFTHKGKPNHVLILEVDEDIQECHTRLANAGFPITPIKDSGGCGKSFDVYDPDGNLIKLWFGYPR